MKKFLRLFCFVLACCFVFTACDSISLKDLVTPNPDKDITEGPVEDQEQKPVEDEEQTPPAHTHEWSAWTIAPAPTCQTKGVATRTCACGESESWEVEKTAHNPAHVSAKAESCTEAGNVEYWVCNVCDKYFSNAVATDVIVDKTSVVIPATGHQSVTAHAAQAPTYTEAGNVAYWECEDCDTYFSDEACTTKIADKSSVILPVLVHTGTITHHAATLATCENAGNIEYWSCDCCDKYFSNAAATNVIVDKTSVVIPATGHQSVTAHAAQAPTYTEAGNVAYWECEDCDTYFSDEACTTKIADKSSVILPVLAHTGTITHHAAVSATCEGEGNVEYWSCDCCDKYFSNAVATDVIVDKTSVVIPATRHEGATHHAPQVASCIAGNIEYWACADCDTYFADAACTAKITDKLSVILPADGGCTYDVNNVCAVCNQALQYTEGLKYTAINNGEAYEVSGIGTATDTDVVIPYYYNQKPVTSIGYEAFYGCYNLTSVTLPASVTSIGYEAFCGCENLTSITIPASVTSIGDGAFCNCYSLTSITIPASVTSIGYRAFSGCTSLTSITIPASVTSIGNDAFSWCYDLTTVTFAANSQLTSIDSSAFYCCSNLTSITIPASVTSIGDYAFEGCNLLESITVAAGNAVYHSAGNCLIETASGTLIVGCKNSVIPADGSVTSIGSYAFSWCTSLTSITIPAGVTSIGDRAFYNCYSLTSITISASVTSIGDWAFYNCYSLTSITIPASVTSIGYRAFSGCTSLTSITIPASVTSIGNDAFSWCYDLTTVTFAANSQLTSIGEDAFYNCSNLTSITIPASVTSIGNDAFSWCTSLTSITIPAGVTSIGNSAFSYCYGLTSIAIPASVTSIGNDAFSWCTSLTSITIPAGVTSIGDGAFYNCYNLTSITIPASVTSIGYDAFYNCDSLTDVYFGGTEEQWNEIDIDVGNDALCNATIHFAQ